MASGSPLTLTLSLTLTLTITLTLTLTLILALALTLTPPLILTRLSGGRHLHIGRVAVCTLFGAAFGGIAGMLFSAGSKRGMTTNPNPSPSPSPNPNANPNPNQA